MYNNSYILQVQSMWETIIKPQYTYSTRVTIYMLQQMFDCLQMSIKHF